MSKQCPPGEKWSQWQKKCVKKEFLPASPGHSKSPCPEGKVWNPNPGVRKCISKEVFEKHFGKDKLRAASAEQKRLRATRKNAAAAAPGPSVRRRTPNARPVAAAAPVEERRASRAPPAIIPDAGLGRPMVTPAKMIKSQFEVDPKLRDDSIVSPGLKKEDILKWTAKHCKNQEDPTSMDEFKDMSVEDLRSLVRLGNGFCYPLETLDTHVRSSVERQVPVRDMYVPSYRLDAKDFGALKAVGERVKKGYELPFTPVEMPAEHYKLYIDVVNDPNYKFLFLYDDRKVKVGPNGTPDYTPALADGGWLGYIPTKGTDELVSLIKKAFLSGRMFVKATRPFQCCRMHLKKDKKYWEDNTTQKIKAMVDELKEHI